MSWRQFVLSSATLALWLMLHNAQAFIPQPPFPSTCNTHQYSTTTLFAMNRKARRQQKKQQENISKARLLEVIKDDDDDSGSSSTTTATRDEATDDPVYIGNDDKDDDIETPRKSADSVTSGASTMAEKVAATKEQRPEVSRIVVDEETGIEIVEQGQKVMDVVTREAVKMSDLGPEYRLAQMFPGVPPEVRQKYRFDWSTVEATEMAKQLGEACRVKLADGTTGIPPVPSISNKALDFVTANRDLLGWNMERALVRMMLHSQWKEDLDAARGYRDLARHLFLIENHISAPFRQAILDGEERIGPNFGNLDITTYCGKEVYERAADYLVLKGMVSHWSQKYRDADELERIGPRTRDNYLEIVETGDPKRFLPENQIIWQKKDCEQILSMALKMCNLFVETEELFNDLPVEIRFLEAASRIQDGTTLRKFVVEDFCPAQGIEPEGLREGLRRLLRQLDNMQVDPYEDIWFVVDRILGAMEEGTSDERNPYAPILLAEEDGPGFFQTYTFDSPKRSIIRFLDQRLRDREEVSVQDVGNMFTDMFSFAPAAPEALRGDVDEDGYAIEDDISNYKIPEERAAGRPHELGWLDNLDMDENAGPAEIKPGKIIFEE